MTVRELIIETELQVQRLAGAQRNKTAPEITIWRLNTAQNRLIKSKIKREPNESGRYMIDQKSNTDLQNLQVPNFKLISFKDTDNRSYGYLPSDFGYLLNSRSVVLDDCKTEFATALLAVSPYRVTVIDFGDSGLPTGPFYINNLAGFNANSVALVGSGVPSKEQKFEYISSIIDAFKQLGLEVYWEKFDSIYKQGAFIAVQPFPLTGAGTPVSPAIIVLILDAAFSQNATASTIKGVNGDGNFQRYKTFIGLTREVANRVMKQDFVYDALTNNYYDRPTPDSPICHLSDGKVFVHSNKKFLVSEIIIDYIRKPRAINLSLNQTSELVEELHEELCSIAAELILSNQEAPNYPLKVQENLNRLE